MIPHFVRLLLFQLTRPVRGEPLHKIRQRRNSKNFNSLAPCGANHSCIRKLILISPFQLTRPVRGEPRVCGADIDDPTISTHSPRAGRTRRGCQIPQFFVRISTHSPRAGRTSRRLSCQNIFCHFNSLAPCGANRDDVHNRRRRCYFNSLAPCGANHGSICTACAHSNISTHSPRAGRTLAVNSFISKNGHFNSLAPCGANPDQPQKP